MTCGSRIAEAFLKFCLLGDSDPISDQDRLEIAHNQQAVAIRGREPGLVLRRRGRDEAVRSLTEQQEIEAADTMSSPEYLENYFRQPALDPKKSSA